MEAQERLTYERKRQLKEALASGKPLPTELRKDAQQLSKELAFDEAQVGSWAFYSKLSHLIERRIEPSTHVDNEYYNAGIMDPKILITTSRDPSSKLLQFSKVRFSSRAIDGQLTSNHR